MERYEKAYCKDNIMDRYAVRTDRCIYVYGSCGFRKLD